MDYPPRIRELLERAGATQGDAVVVTAKGRPYPGVLMPHHSFSGEDVLTVKLGNGYNVGILSGDVEAIRVSAKASPAKAERRLPSPRAGRPTLAVLGTGGTIASYVDYRTGAVHPAIGRGPSIRPSRRRSSSSASRTCWTSGTSGRGSSTVSTART